MDANRIISSRVHRLNAEVSEHLEKASSEPSMKHLKMRREMQEMREFLVPWRGIFVFFLWSWKQKKHLSWVEYVCIVSVFFLLDACSVFFLGGWRGDFFWFLFVEEPTRSVISAEPIKNWVRLTKCEWQVEAEFLFFGDATRFHILFLGFTTFQSKQLNRYLTTSNLRHVFSIIFLERYKKKTDIYLSHQFTRTIRWDTFFFCRAPSTSQVWKSTNLGQVLYLRLSNASWKGVVFEVGFWDISFQSNT